MKASISKQQVEAIEKQLQDLAEQEKTTGRHLYLEYSQLKDYFYALRHIYESWSIEYAKRVVAGLPKLSYVAEFRHFLIEGPVVNTNPETVQWVTDYIDYNLPLQE